MRTGGSGTVAAGSSIGEQLISLWHSEIFSIPAKFSLCHNFSIIAKVNVHCENSNFGYACNFCYDSEISPS